MTYEEFTTALKQFCLDHGFEIAGTCEAEGIYGEISVTKIGDKPDWKDWDNRKFNFTWTQKFTLQRGTK